LGGAESHAAHSRWNVAAARFAASASKSHASTGPEGSFGPPPRDEKEEEDEEEEEKEALPAALSHARRSRQGPDASAAAADGGPGARATAAASSGDAAGPSACPSCHAGTSLMLLTLEGRVRRERTRSEGGKGWASEKESTPRAASITRRGQAARDADTRARASSTASSRMASAAAERGDGK
jgi:hypothetical protein